MLNSIVHVIMYFYYLVAALGPKYQKYIWWKQHLTRIQILQFVLVIIYFASIVVRKCHFQTHNTVTLLLSINTVTFLYLFVKYYQRSYSPSKASYQSVEALYKSCNPNHQDKVANKKKYDIDMANNNLETKPDANKKKDK
jgi:hypothetical protein